MWMKNHYIRILRYRRSYIRKAKKERYINWVHFFLKTFHPYLEVQNLFTSRSYSHKKKGEIVLFIKGRRFVFVRHEKWQPLKKHTLVSLNTTQYLRLNTFKRWKMYKLHIRRRKKTPIKRRSIGSEYSISARARALVKGSTVSDIALSTLYFMRCDIEVRTLIARGCGCCHSLQKMQGGGGFPFPPFFSKR